MSAISSSASSLQANYLNLLITQLQHQDPLNPMDNNEMAGQLAQLSSLQQMENLNTSFDRVLANNQMSYATSLLGREVSYIGSGDQPETLKGLVQAVKMVDGQVMVSINNMNVDPSTIVSVQNAQP